MTRAAHVPLAIPSPPISDDFICAREIREALPLPEWLAGIVAAPLMRALALHRINAMHRRMRPHTDPQDYVSTLLARFNVRADVAEQDLERIPSAGPVVVVANHPFGAIEGILLTALLAARRSDVKLLANHLLGRIGPLREFFILVDPFETPGVARRNAISLRQSLNWLKDGGLLAVFPAGEVAHRRSWLGHVEESSWNETIDGLIQRSGASVVPVHFTGHNSLLFQLAGLIHPRLRTALLPRELLKQQGRSIRVSVGAPIAPSTLQRSTTAHGLMAHLRARTLLLAHRQSCAKRTQPSATSAAKALEPIAPPVPSGHLAAEIAALPAHQRLIATGPYLVCAATADQAPWTVQELGRLREITFRAAGEGTGQSRDLDVFDQYYRHLFIWDRGHNELIGAYRLAFTDQLPTGKIRSLYTSTLFRYAPDFLNRIGPAVELGRSFIRREHQRSYAFLLLLWKGIRALVTQDGRYARIFGAVSISRDYSDASRLLMAEFLSRHHTHPDLADSAHPRHRFQPHCARAAIRDLRAMAARLESANELSSVVSDLERDRKGLPILLKHYLAIGAKVLAFNVDPSFCHALDALTVLEMSDINARFLRRLTA